MAGFALRQVGAILGLGRDVGALSTLQVSLRTLVIYGFALVIVRVGSTRFRSEASAFDIVVAILLGSILSRAVNGPAPFVPTLAGAGVLIGIHWLLAALACRVAWLGPLVKGRPIPLARDGRADRSAMRRAGVADDDLAEALRLRAHRSDLAQVRLATLERSGAISVIPAAAAPAVLDVKVEHGVQTVRIRLE